MCHTIAELINNMKMKSCRSSIPPTIKSRQRTVSETANRDMRVSSSHRALGRRSSLDCSEHFSNVASAYERDNRTNRKTERRHSVCIVAVEESRQTTKSTQTKGGNIIAKAPQTNSSGQSSSLRPIILSHSDRPKLNGVLDDLGTKGLRRTTSLMSTLKPGVELKPILKCTNGTKATLLDNKQYEDPYLSKKDRDCAISAIPDIKCCYRLPEKRQAKLQKTVSFQEDSYRTKVRKFSRTYSSPEVPLPDDMFNLDDMGAVLEQNV